MTDYVTEDDDEDDGYNWDPDSVCGCGQYTQCEHKNWVIDQETEVRKVVSKWAENGSNIFLHGSHGNWVAGIKEDECDASNHAYCFNSEFDNTDAAGHKFDSRGFFIDLPPLPQPRLAIRRLQAAQAARPTHEAAAIARMMELGAITQPEYDAMMGQLQRDYEAMRRSVETVRQRQGRYVTFPVHVSRGGGVPYDPDFRDNLQELRDTLFSNDERSE